jgi:3-methyladenine DNA glycosylase AlkD
LAPSGIVVTASRPLGSQGVKMNATTRTVLEELEGVADPSRKPGMAHVGINVERALGVSIPTLRALARRHRGDHPLALDLWRSGVHEARILASMVDDPAQVTAEQMEAWVVDFDSWDLCDQVCGNLFGATSFALRTARAWTRRPEEFVKRAGFVLIAERAVRDRTSPDRVYAASLPAIRRGAIDERNYVKKAVNWALRQIGKRSANLNALAIAEAEELLTLGSPSARWIARDALRELRSASVQARLKASGR